MEEKNIENQNPLVLYFEKIDKLQKLYNNYIDLLRQGNMSVDSKLNDTRKTYDLLMQNFLSYLSNAFHFDMDSCLRDNDVYVEDIKNNDLIDKIKIVLANLCKNNNSEDIKIIKEKGVLVTYEKEFNISHTYFRNSYHFTDCLQWM